MKNLLTENEIRKMMKYANINKLADGFVDRLTESTVNEEETVDEAYMADDDDDKPMEEGEYMADDDEPMEEMPPTADDAADAPAGGDMDLTALVSDIAAALEKHTGVEVEVEEGPEGDMGAEPEMDMDADMSPDMDDMGGMDDEPAEEPMEEMAHMADDDEKPMEEQEETLEEVVNMIARRVAKRILTEQ